MGLVRASPEESMSPSNSCVAREPESPCLSPTELPGYLMPATSHGLRRSRGIWDLHAAAQAERDTDEASESGSENLSENTRREMEINEAMWQRTTLLAGLEDEASPDEHWHENGELEWQMTDSVRPSKEAYPVHVHKVAGVILSHPVPVQDERPAER